MKRNFIFILLVSASMYLVWGGGATYAGKLTHSDAAAKKLEFIRRNLSMLMEMKYSDAKKYYEEGLKELNALIKEYPDTNQALEATFFAGNVYKEMFKFNEAVQCFDTVLSQEEISELLKAKALYFKAESLISKGEIDEARETIVSLRKIDPRAADHFGSELSGGLRVGKEAPTFIAKDFTGKQIDLSQYKGNITVINFWATWCVPCMQDFHEVIDMYNNFKNRGVKFIGISLDERIEELKGYVEYANVEWPQIYDGKRWEGDIPKLYNISRLPTFIVLDQENKVRYLGGSTRNVSRVISFLLSESKELPAFTY